MDSYSHCYNRSNIAISVSPVVVGNSVDGLCSTIWIDIAIDIAIDSI